MIKKFREKLKQGVVGCFSKTEDPAIIETMGYAGADFVAAVSGEQIIELLGNRNAAAGILGTLGKASGNVRMPGEEIPYAMFLPLKEDVPAPSYFGFAFD
jgi:hypothetical protein